MSREIRQALVDRFTIREFVASFDKSVREAPATKYNDAGQLIADLLSVYGGDDPRYSGSFNPAPTKPEIVKTLKKKLVPQLVKPREGYQLDTTSGNETVSGREDDYGGLNGEDIQNLDLDIAGLARHNNIPTGYKPPSSSLSPKDREAWQRNVDKVAGETLPSAPPKPMSEFEQYLAKECARCAAPKKYRDFTCPDPTFCAQHAQRRKE